MDSGAILPVFEPQIFLSNRCDIGHIIYLTFLCLCFPTCKMQVIMYLFQQAIVKTGHGNILR